MTDTNKNTLALQAAYQAFESAKAELEKIQAAVNGKPLPELGNDAAEKARRDLEDCLARRSLGEGSDQEEAKARSEFESAESEFAIRQKMHALIKLELGGLHRLLQRADHSMVHAEQMKNEAEKAWILEELRRADESYTMHAMELARNYERVLMCAGALKKRDVEMKLAFSSSADLAVPTIGPTSCAALIEKMNSRELEKNPSGYAKLLVNFSRLDMYKPKSDDVERDIQEAITNSAQTPGRFAKIVSVLGAKRAS
ncbi:MAG: hypothetical protein H7240_09045 [Glaciimonas sp.]|nr:hypothetical protein [Glaciimonas sp.]